MDLRDAEPEEGLFGGGRGFDLFFDRQRRKDAFFLGKKNMYVKGSVLRNAFELHILFLDNCIDEDMVTFNSLEKTFVVGRCVTPCNWEAAITGKITISFLELLKH